jgi:uncharacterized membrane protein
VRTERGFERLTTFADAVVAIALTLLVLPLVDIPQELKDGEGLDDALGDHWTELLGFLISFVVIWALWSVHHRTMEYFDAYDPVIFRLTMIWLFTIVVLPFTTQLLTSALSSRGATALYDGVLVISSLSLVGISWWGRRRPELLIKSQHEEVSRWTGEPLSVSTAIIFTVNLVLVLIWPAVGSYPLFALLVDDSVERWFVNRWRRRAAAGTAPAPRS